MSIDEFRLEEITLLINNSLNRLNQSRICLFILFIYEVSIKLSSFISCCQIYRANVSTSIFKKIQLRLRIAMKMINIFQFCLVKTQL